MSIHSISGKTNNVPAPAKSTQTQKVNNTDVSSTEKQNDRVDITTVANKITKALESSTSTPAINEERVNAVREALENGTYPIDAQEIAKKMMQMEQEHDQINSR